ncbi:MAG: hypothetical protein ACE3JK_17315 [Sporolactobacillus sp.]
MDFQDLGRNFQIYWLVSESNNKARKLIRLIMEVHCCFKDFETSIVDTFAYVLAEADCLNGGLSNTLLKLVMPFLITLWMSVI